MSFVKRIKETAEMAQDMMFPSGITCYVCSAELDGTTPYHLCADCALEFNKTSCARCGQKLGSLAEYCDRCIAHGTYHFEKARSAVVFTNAAQRLIHALKYGDSKFLAPYMAQFMAESAQIHTLLADAITFVPLHKKRQKKRGYNQSQLLAESLSTHLNIPVFPLLEKTRHTKNLAKLNRKQREQVIEGTFAALPHTSALSGGTILLVDDVFTTGATADECAKVLKRVGIAKVVVLTFASVFSMPKHSPKIQSLPKGESL